MSFATWLSPEFQLYIMKDYRRLKSDENSRLSLNWNLNRELSKLNYKDIKISDKLKKSIDLSTNTLKSIIFKQLNLEINKKNVARLNNIELPEQYKYFSKNKKGQYILSNKFKKVKNYQKILKEKTKLKLPSKSINIYNLVKGSKGFSTLLFTAFPEFKTQMNVTDFYKIYKELQNSHFIFLNFVLSKYNDKVGGQAYPIIMARGSTLLQLNNHYLIQAINNAFSDETAQKYLKIIEKHTNNNKKA